MTFDTFPRFTSIDGDILYRLDGTWRNSLIYARATGFLDGTDSPVGDDGPLSGHIEHVTPVLLVTWLTGEAAGIPIAVPVTGEIGAVDVAGLQVTGWHVAHGTIPCEVSEVLQYAINEGSVLSGQQWLAVGDDPDEQDAQLIHFDLVLEPSVERRTLEHDGSVRR